MHKLQPVFWIYALVGTAGLVAIVPSILRAIDGHDQDMIRGSIGFGGTTFGVIGTLLSFTQMRWVIALVLATMFGLAAAALQGEVLSAQTRMARDKRDSTHEDV